MKNKIINLFIVFIFLLSFTGCKKEENKEDVKYYLNIVYFNDIGKKTLYFNENTMIEKPVDPTKDGCIFSGWYYDINYTIPVTFPFKLTKDTSIYAGWYNAFVYELDEETNTYGIKVGSYGVESVVVPSTYNNLPVTKILENAFENRPQLKSVILPDSIIEIEDGAFGYCPKLTTIYIPDSVKKIGKGVFDGCDELVYEKYNGLKYLGNWLIDAKDVYMDRTKLKDSTIGICSEAFLGNKHVSEIVIPNGVTEIYSNTFKESSITKLVIHENVTSIDLSSFDYTSNLVEIDVHENNKVYKSIDGVLFNYDVTTLLKYPQAKVSLVYSVPSTVTKVNEKAFRNVLHIFKLNLSSSLTTIEDYAFSGCKNLSEINFNDKLEFIGFEAFRDCENVQKFILPKSIHTIEEGALRKMIRLVELTLPYIANDDPDFNLAYIFGGEEYVQKNLRQIEILGGDRIRENSFNGLTQVDNLLLPPSISNIEEGSFSCIEKLYNISFTNGSDYYKIYQGALYTKDETILLTTVSQSMSIYFQSLPSTKVIYKYAFNGCLYVEKIMLNEGLESIHGNAFYMLPSLKELHIPSTVKETGQDICFYTPNVKIYTKLPVRPDEWCEGWNTMNYPVVWNAHYPSFKNVEIEKVIGLNETHVVTFTIEDAPDNPQIVLISLDPHIATVDGFTVKGISTGTAILELYIVGYEEYKCYIAIHVGY